MGYIEEAQKKQFKQKLAQLPKKNGKMLNLQTTKTYDNPHQSMVHGEPKITISYIGYVDVVFESSQSERFTESWK